MTHYLHNTTSRRQAFTLIEILVVIAIIAVLAGLGAWGTIAMIGTQQRRNTESTLRVLETMLHARWKPVIEDAKKEPISAATHANLFQLAGSDPARARVIWIKVRLAEAFPITYDEVKPKPAITIVNTYIPDSQRKPHFTKYQNALSGLSGPQPGESSACLLMALRTLQGDGVDMSDQLKHAVLNRDGDPSPNKIDTLYDGFGKPLVFIRFAVDPLVDAANPSIPTNIGNVATWTKAYKFSDPVDTEGTLLNNLWYNAAPVPPPLNNRQKFEAQFLYTIAKVAPPLPLARADYVVPVIFSSGKDGVVATTKDNIYSFNLRGN